MQKSKNKNDPGVGGQYEINVPAYFALKLNSSQDVEDFTIRSNVAGEFGNLDDIVINVTVQNGGPLNFAFQLKHREKGTNVSPGAFEGSKGKFSLEKYCAAFKNMSQDLRENYYFILYTCQNFDGNRKEEVKQFTMLEDERCPGKVFFDTSSDLGNTYKFEVNNETTRLDGTAKSSGVTKLDYQQFFSKLTLYTGQKKFQEFEKLILEILKEQNVVNSYLTLFRKWHQGLFTNKTIDRKTINYHLVDTYLSSFMITDYRLSDNEHETMYLFERATKDFDATIIDVPKENFSANLKTLEIVDDLRLKALEVSNIEEYRRQFKIDPKSTLTECILRMAKEHKFIEKAEMGLNEAARNKIFCFCLQKLLIVDFNQYSAEAVYNLMEVYRTKEDKIKLILLGPDVNLSRLSVEDVFYNLEDLAKKNDQLYQEIATQCRISLQGRPCITLKQLVEAFEDLKSVFEAKQIVQMSMGPCSLGDEKLKVPLHYVPRNVSTNVFDLDGILDSAKRGEIIIIVHADDRFKNNEKKLLEKGFHVIEMAQYVGNKNSLINKSKIIWTVAPNSVEELEAICAEEATKPVHVFKALAEGRFILIRSTSEFNCKNSIILPCLQSDIHSVFDSGLNLLVADPGMGKSTFLKYLRNECPWSFWPIYAELKSHSAFLSQAHTSKEVLMHFMDTDNQETNFLKKFQGVFEEKRKLILFLDGLDELPMAHVGTVLETIDSLVRTGHHVWVSSRQNLEQRLLEKFNLFSLRMVEISEKHQKQYIQDRLNSVYAEDEITEIIDRIFEGIKIANNTQFLGIPLQLYILTQIFLDENHDHHARMENFFVLTKLYRHFFKGRYRHCFVKHETHSPFLPNASEYLEQYEIAALESILDEESLKKLQIDRRPLSRFLSKIEFEKDALGIVAKVERGKATFEHQTYAEFFASVWLKHNQGQAKELRDELLSENYEHLRLMLNVIMAENHQLHLAIIYKNSKRVGTHIEDVDRTDEAGRTALHIICCSPMKYVHVEVLNMLRHKNVAEPQNYRTIVEKLFERTSRIRDKDLFGFDCLDYACASGGLYALEVALRLKLIEFSAKRRAFYRCCNRLNLILYCVKLGYPNLLNEILKEKPNAVKIQIMKMSLLEIAMRTLCNNTREDLIESYVGTVETLIDNGVNVDQEFVFELGFEFEPNALSMACTHGHWKIVKKLLDMDATAVCNGGDNLLHHVCSLENPNEDLINFLLGRVDINAPNDKGTTPFHLACKNGQSAIVEKVLQREDQVVSNILQTSDEEGNNALHYAVQSEKGNGNVTTLLMNRSSTIRSPDGSLYINTRNRNGTTAFHLACKYRKLDLVKETLEREKSVVSDILQTLDKNGNNALHYAAESKDDNRTVIALLIDKGIDINHENGDGRTPLHGACDRISITNIPDLLQMGAKVNSPDSEECTPLACALKRAPRSKHPELVDLFIQYEYDMSAKHATRVLNIACRHSDLNVVEELFARGAQMDGEILHYAASSSEPNKEIIEFLLKDKCVDVNATNSQGKTALQVASCFANMSVLLAAGAQPSSTTKRRDLRPALQRLLGEDDS